MVTYRRRRPAPALHISEVAVKTGISMTAVLIVTAFWLGRWSAGWSGPQASEGAEASSVMGVREPSGGSPREGRADAVGDAPRRGASGTVDAAPALTPGEGSSTVVRATKSVRNHASSGVESKKPAQRRTVRGRVVSSVEGEKLAQERVRLGSPRQDGSMPRELAVSEGVQPRGAEAGGEVSTTSERPDAAMPAMVPIDSTGGFGRARPPIGRYGIQVAAYPSLAAAEAFVRRHQALLDEVGPLFVVERMIGTKLWFRVRVGAFERIRSAKKVASQLQATFDTAMVVRYR